MKFLVDAQLPPALARWLREAGHEAQAVREVGLREAEDGDIWNHALTIGAVVITSKAGAEGKLFGSLGTTDIAEAVTRMGLPLARSEVRLPTGPLRNVGEHNVALHLHADIDVSLIVNIIAEEQA